MSKNPVLVIHGGAGSRSLSPQQRAQFSESLADILRAVYPRLNGGLSALAAVSEAVKRLEDDPLYNAGKGSKIQSDGHIRMSSSIMDGQRRRFAGVVNVEGVKNPVKVAQRLLKGPDRVLSGLGARRYAREAGLEFASPFTAQQRAAFAKRRKGKTGTVGAVALDSAGRLAAATSTGGRGFEYPFRVSDSPTVAGNFANAVCAVSATGTGEEIVEFAVASTLCAWVEAGMPFDSAVRRLLLNARKAGREFGWIALDRRGFARAVTTTPALLWGMASASGIFCGTASEL